MEQGEGSASKPYHQMWSKFDEQDVSGDEPDMESLEEDFKSLLIVPSNSIHSDVEFRSDEVEMHSDVEVSSFENEGWCKITKNSDLCSETSQNKRSQENNVTVVCPHCSSDVQSVGRNRFRHRIEKEIWQSSDEELAGVDSYELKKSLPITNYRKKPRSKRPRSMRVEDSYGTNLACVKCGTEYGELAFQCNQKTVHLQCHACGGMMPCRTDICVPQHCLGCDKAFCGAYWQSQQVTRRDSFRMCTLKQIGERSILRIPFLAHEWNRYEQQITERCIQQMGKTIQDVVSEWVTKLDNQEIDLTRMPLNRAYMITSESHVCNECYDKLVSFLLYWFRICLPKDHLPADATTREDCWYGYTCRTQHHNEDHARKRNHVCPPTKGGIRN